MTRYSLALLTFIIGFSISATADCLQGGDCPASEVATQDNKSDSDVISNENNVTPPQATPADPSQPAQSLAEPESNLAAFDDMSNVEAGDTAACQRAYDDCGRAKECSDYFLRCNNLALGQSR